MPTSMAISNIRVSVRSASKVTKRTLHGEYSKCETDPKPYPSRAGELACCHRSFPLGLRQLVEDV